MYANEKFINESEVKESCEVNTRDNPCKYTPTLKYFMKSELKKPWLTVKGVIVSTNITFIDQTLNLCIVDKFPMANIFINTFYELLRKNINFEMKCPFEPVSMNNNRRLNPNLIIFRNFIKLNPGEMIIASSQIFCQ